MAARPSKGSSQRLRPGFREFPGNGRAGGPTGFPGPPSAGSPPDPKQPAGIGIGCGQDLAGRGDCGDWDANEAWLFCVSWGLSVAWVFLEVLVRQPTLAGSPLIAAVFPVCVLFL